MKDVGKWVFRKQVKLKEDQSERLVLGTTHGTRTLEASSLHTSDKSFMIGHC